MQATTTPGFRGYHDVQPLHVQHPSSSPLGSNEKLSCGTKIGTVRLSDPEAVCTVGWSGGNAY